jgi:hypothetical protein
VKGLSIGYCTIDYEIDRATGARLLKEVDLWEGSIVTFAMLPEAQITGAKAFDPRALEAALKSELNLSGAAAVKAVAIVKKHLREGGPEPEQPARDGLKELLMSLRRRPRRCANRNPPHVALPKVPAAGWGRLAVLRRPPAPERKDDDVATLTPR